eukprot:77012_1
MSASRAVKKVIQSLMVDFDVLKKMRTTYQKRKIHTACFSIARPLHRKAHCVTCISLVAHYQDIEEKQVDIGEICNVLWNDCIYQWNHNDWSLFIMYLLLISKVNTIKFIKSIIISVSYKVQQSSIYEQYTDFIKNIDIQIKPLIKTHKKCVLSSFNIDITPTNGMKKDIAVKFDSNSWKMNHIWLLKQLQPKQWKKYGVDFLHNVEDKSIFPAYTYWRKPRLYIIDSKTHKMIIGPEKYIQYRIQQTLTRQQLENKKFMKWVKYCMKWIYFNVSLIIAPPYFDGNKEEWMRVRFIKYIYPWRTRKLHKKYYWKIDGEAKEMPMFCQQICCVCKARERFDDTKLEKGKRYVDKMYCCKCLTLYVCSKKCYKIAWSRKPYLHRNHCIKKIKNML